MTRGVGAQSAKRGPHIDIEGPIVAITESDAR
jgi:hypothetical protein